MKKESQRKFKNFLPFFLLVAVVFFAGLALIKPGYFSMHDDIQVMRLYQMERCFQDGQLPCRWVPDMGAGYGHPLYNYHPVFPYYLGMVCRLLGLSFLDTVKTLFLLALF